MVSTDTFSTLPPSHLRLGFPNGLFRSTIPAKTLPRVSLPPARVTRHSIGCGTLIMIRLHNHTQSLSLRCILRCQVCTELWFKSVTSPFRAKPTQISCFSHHFIFSFKEAAVSTQHQLFPSVACDVLNIFCIIFWVLVATSVSRYVRLCSQYVGSHLPDFTTSRPRRQ